MRRRRASNRVRWEVALHEARHIVYAIVYAVPGVLCVVIDLAEGPLGAVQVNPETVLDAVDEPGGRSVAIAFIACMLVGYMGAGKWFPDLPDGREVAKHWPPSYLEAWDANTAESMAARMGALSITREEYAEACIRAEAFCLDNDCKAAVEAVAKALLDQPVMTRADAAAIAAQHLARGVLAEAVTITNEETRP